MTNQWGTASYTSRMPLVLSRLVPWERYGGSTVTSLLRGSSGKTF